LILTLAYRKFLVGQVNCKIQVKNLSNSVLIYDGSFEGLLTCIFQVYEQKIIYCYIQRQHVAATTLFNEELFVQTEPVKLHEGGKV
jgi:hypothetical protein